MNITREEKHAQKAVNDLLSFAEIDSFLKMMKVPEGLEEKKTNAIEFILTKMNQIKDELESFTNKEMVHKLLKKQITKVQKDAEQ